MKKLLTLILATIMLASLFVGCQKQEESPETFSVGYAKANITPDPEWNMGLYGYNDQKTRRSTGVLEPLYATCVAINDGQGQTMLVFGLDMLHSTTWIVQEVREQIREKLGIENQYVQFTASHTHSAPSHDEKLIVVDKFNKLFIDGCVAAAEEAVADLAPAEMFTHFMRLDGVVYRRHFLLSDGTYWGRPLTNLPNNASGYSVLGAADNMMQLVKFTREGKKDVLLVNWQGHSKGNPDGHYTEYSSSNIGIMRRVLLEQANVESVFFLGAGGDANNSSELDTTARSRTYVELGNLLASAIMKEYDNFKPAQTGKINVQWEIFNIPTNEIDYILSAFSFGEVGFAMAPYEMFTSIALSIKENSPYKMTFIGTLANGSSNTFYMPDSAAFDYECYEKSQKYVKGDAEIFRDEFLRLLDLNFAATGMTEEEKAEGYIMDRSPKLAEGEFVNPAPGVAEMVTAVNNNLYRIYLRYSGAAKMFLVEGEELATKIMNTSEPMQLYLDDRSVIVGIEE